VNALTVADFGEFFEAVHGNPPFRWQVRLVEQLLETGLWPEQLAAPTGSGKTSVIDAHVFAVAAMATGGTVVPRRLSLVVPRRVLVDSQYEHACALAKAFRHAVGGDGVMGRIADALASLRWKEAPALGPVPRSPLVVARLRGGLPAPRAWRDDPTACAVISATPDMWGSRLLLRSYGSSPLAWPREAGLLGKDAVVVVDEAHLCRQLITAARSVAALQTQVDATLEVPDLQGVAATATQSDKPKDGEAAKVIGVEPADLDDEKALSERLRSPKPVRTVGMVEWPYRDPDKERPVVVQRIVDEALALRRSHEPTVGVFVNTVRMAIEVSKALREADVEGHKAVTVMVCGRMRRHDLEAIKADYRGLFDLEGNKEVDFLVATPSLEVGVDIDLSSMVSELAPGASLAQRAGRVNRLGRRVDTSLVIVGPGEEEKERRIAAQKNKKKNKKNVDRDSEKGGDESQANEKGPLQTAFGIYKWQDLLDAWSWVKRREADQAGMSPWALVDDPPPPTSERRTLYQRVEMADSWWWARSSDKLDPAPELDLWLDDDLEPDQAEGGVVVRHSVPDDSEQALGLLRAMPPRNHEIFPAPIWYIRDLLARLLESEGGTGVALLVRDGEPIFVDAGEDDPRVRPGDVLVIGDDVPAFISKVVASGAKSGGGNDRECMDDVSEALRSPQAGDVVLRVDSETWGPSAGPLLEAYEDMISSGLTPREQRDGLAELIKAQDRERQMAGTADSSETQKAHTMVDAAAELLRGRLKDCDVICFSEEEHLVRIVVVDQRAAVSDDGCRQTWTPGDKPVPLEKHSKGVAARAQNIAESVKLRPELVELLRLAGLHHDDGKADPRFQRVLGAVDGELLAKSGRVSTSRGNEQFGLPARWRHEQLSAAKTAEALNDIDESQRDIIVRLVGTSHGHGRSGFPHNAAELGADPGHPDERAVSLFDEGEWDEIIERTDRRFGVWGCAYLEALLRAADGQISGEGS